MSHFRVLIRPIALCLAAAGWLFYSLLAQAACSTITGSGATKTCAFSGNLTEGITTSSVNPSADDSAIITIKPNSSLGSVTLDRAILVDLATLDITTGGLQMSGGLHVYSGSVPQPDKNSPDGRDGRALTLNFSNFLSIVSSSARAIDLSEGAPNGYTWACQFTGAQCNKSGGQGGDGAKFTVNAAGSISSTYADRVFNLYSQGGHGGDASVPFGLLGSGRSGGSGGAGGALSFLTSAALSINPSFGDAMVLQSFGGSGGHGAEGDGGGTGGAGGQGGALTVDTRSGTLTTPGGAGQVRLYTAGGYGGTGGNNTLNKGQPGGGGGSGGNITVNIDKRLSISDIESGVAAISLQTVGGNGGQAGRVRHRSWRMTAARVRTAVR